MSDLVSPDDLEPIAGDTASEVVHINARPYARRHTERTDPSSLTLPPRGTVTRIFRPESRAALINESEINVCRRIVIVSSLVYTCAIRTVHIPDINTKISGVPLAAGCRPSRGHVLTVDKNPER